MKKLFKTIIKLIIIVIVLLAVLKVCFGKDDKPEPKHEEPKVVEKQEDPKSQEVVEESEPELEPEVEVEEEPQEEDVDQNGIRPEFQKSMESYEAFFDEYIEFLNAFKQDSTSLSMITKYAEFMAKYEKAMSEMDAINEDELTDAEDKLFLETQLRINNKLAEAAINY